MIFQFSKRQKDSILFGMEYHDNWLLKSSCFQFFGDGKYSLFLSQNVDGNMIFTDHWKVLVLNFSEMGNTVIFLSQKVDWNIIFVDYRKVLVLNFSEIANTVFFEPKSWWKDDIYLVFLNFSWYSRTWGIWFFLQC